MKKASRVLYVIGNVFNIINIVCSTLMIVLGAIVMAKPERFAEEFAKQNVAELSNIEQVKALGLAILAITIMTIAAEIIILILSKKAIKNLDNNENTKGIHIVMIVASVICGGIFYLIASILAVCAVSEQTTKKVE